MAQKPGIKFKIPFPTNFLAPKGLLITKEWGFQVQNFRILMKSIFKNSIFIEIFQY